MSRIWQRAARVCARTLSSAIAATALLPSPPARAGEFDACTATHVVDGDTLYVDCAGREHNVRLLRVDTPERNEPGYEAARDALSRAVEHRRLRLEFEEPGTPSYGTYGRLLAYVFAQLDARDADELFVNAELVRGGYSRFWTKYGRGRYASVLEAAEAEAPEPDPRATERRSFHGGTSAPDPRPDAEQPRAERTPRERAPSCCRVCRTGQPCGDSCISWSKTCRRGRGCACAAGE
ncbi:MAG: thermonuclease family protein [Myxococcota bacterium]